MREINDPHVIFAMACIGLAILGVLVSWALSLERPPPPPGPHNDDHDIPMFGPL